jgi:hypothetical protein
VTSSGKYGARADPDNGTCAAASHGLLDAFCIQPAPVADPRLRIPLIATGRIAIVIAERSLIQLDFEHQGI